MDGPGRQRWHDAEPSGKVRQRGRRKHGEEIAEVLFNVRTRHATGRLPFPQPTQQFPGDLPGQNRNGLCPDEAGQQGLGFRLLGGLVHVQRIDEHVGINGVHATHPG